MTATKKVMQRKVLDFSTEGALEHSGEGNSKERPRVVALQAGRFEVATHFGSGNWLYAYVQVQGTSTLLRSLLGDTKCVLVSLYPQQPKRARSKVFLFSSMHSF